MSTTGEPNRFSRLNPLRLLAEPLSAWRAARIILFFTFLTTVMGGVLIWIADHDEFPDLGTSLWWALQTVTTVGYGDVVPAQTGGRVIGAILMLQGIAFITVVAAAVTAALIEQARRRRHQTGDPEVAARLDRIESRLAAIERGLNSERSASDKDPPGRAG